MTDLLDFTASPALDVAGTAADPAGAAQGLAVPPDGNGTADGPAHPAGTAGEAAALLACAEGMVRRVKTGGWSMSDLRKVSGAAGSLRSCLDSVVCDVTAAMTALSSKGRAAGVISEQTGMSKRDANRVANVAEGLASMPNTKKKLAEGKFTFGHAASLVNAAGAGGAEVIDNDKGLLAQAETKPADVFAGDAKRAALKASRDNGEAELDRQRKARRAGLGKDRDSGMGFLHAELDPISHGLISQVLQTHADRLWRKDSKAGKTGSRSGVQRMADALLETITGLDALTHHPLPDSGAKNSRPQLIITADIGLINGQKPRRRMRDHRHRPRPAVHPPNPVARHQAHRHDLLRRRPKPVARHRHPQPQCRPAPRHNSTRPRAAPNAARPCTNATSTTSDPGNKAAQPTSTTSKPSAARVTANTTTTKTSKQAANPAAARRPARAAARTARATAQPAAPRAPSP